MIFQALNLRNNILIKFLSENILAFLSTYKTPPEPVHSEKIDNCKERQYLDKITAKKKILGL
jgi:hypothetical protein